MAMLRYCLVNCRSKKNLRLIEKDIVVDKVLINKYSLDLGKGAYVRIYC